ncbi:MAG: anti-sigma factor family protein [Candidatus Sumerlaeaceae bacterium]
MALIDGELPDNERDGVESHVRTCPHCNHEFERFEQLNHLTHRCSFTSPPDFSFQNYYRGVCRKLESQASWLHWSAASFLLVLSGTLMFFGFSHNPLAVLLGTIAMGFGAALLWLSYFCSCGKS